MLCRHSNANLRVRMHCQQVPPACCSQDALLRKYQDQIKQLKSDLAAAQSAPDSQPLPAEQHAEPALTRNGGTLNTALLEQVGVTPARLWMVSWASQGGFASWAGV